MLTPSPNFRIVIKTSMNFYSSNQNIYEFLFWPIYFLNFGQLPNQYIYQSTVNKLIANSRERHVGIKITKNFSLRGRENIKDQFRERETIVKKAITTAASSLQCCSSTIAQSSYSPFGFFFSFFLFFLLLSIFPICAIFFFCQFGSWLWWIGQSWLCRNAHNWMFFQSTTLSACKMRAMLLSMLYNCLMKCLRGMII